MTCILTTGYTFLGCKGGAGGIKNVYLTEYGNLAGGTFTAAAGVITAWTLPTGKQFRTYALDKEMGFFTNPGTYTPASGTVSYEPEIDFTIKKLTTTMIQEMHMVAQNTLCMMVQDVNNDVWVFGYDRGMDLVTWGTESGTAITDFNGQKMTFKGKEIVPIYKLTSSLLATLTVPAV